MVECVDDQSIPDTARLWRRVPPEQLKIKDGEYRPSSGLFSTSEMSVHLADLTSVEEVGRQYPTHSIVEITAGLVRSLNLRVVRDPILDTDPPDPSHAIVCPRATGGGARRLASESTFVRLVPPPGSSPTA